MAGTACTNPPDELKIYELSLIWKEAAYNFAFWEQLSKTLDWDKAYREALPRVLKTQNLYEYYLELMRFAALLRDGHTGVYFPQSVQDSAEYASKLPIGIVYFNGRYVVANVKRCAGGDVKRWSVVKKINGTDIQQYIEENIFPYIWHEKPDSADFNQFISRGPLGSRVEFELEYDGETYTAVLTRTKGDTDWLYSGELPKPEAMETAYASPSHKIEMTHDQIAVITIPHMMNGDLPAHFCANFPLLEKAKGYIIDIRYNGGGDSTNSDAVAAAFIAGDCQNQRSLHPIHIGAYKAWGRYMNQHFHGKTWEEVAAEYGASDWVEKTYKIPRHMYYEESKSTNESQVPYPAALSAPLVILMTAATASAAEDFLVIFEHAKRAVFVGTPSYGSTGNPLKIDLESGGGVRICTRRNTYIDGREFINIGIQPHIHFEPSLEDFRNNRDTHLEKGLAQVREMLQ